MRELWSRIDRFTLENTKNKMWIKTMCCYIVAAYQNCYFKDQAAENICEGICYK